MALDLISERANLGDKPPQFCTFLSAGQTFSGYLDIPTVQGTVSWRMNICIQGYDHEHGFLLGTMELPDRPVKTLWEGEIVDAKNHTFVTRRWNATLESDVEYWECFKPFNLLKDQVRESGSPSVELSDFPFIFMRLKECKFYVKDEQDSEYTIDGFYYGSLSLSDGKIIGLYYDRDHPLQTLFPVTSHSVWRMSVDHDSDERGSFSFASYELR